MRLHLIVQRHGLPAAQILWTVSTPAKPPNGAPGTGTTISQFLEQVNEIIPLEADEWGLEDYAVEVQGFECLHFSELSQVLRENDEVCIRPLQTSDLRVRKFSGRHQISTDGKHLIDGVAFGRPFLKRADRPFIRIPPRKRKRITYSEDETWISNPENNDKQVVVRAGFNNADDRESEDESEDDEDFDPDAEDNEDMDASTEDGEGLEAELEGLQKDLQPDEDENFDSARRSRSRSRRESAGLGLDLFGDGTYQNPLLEQYSQNEPLRRPSVLKVGSGASKDGRKVLSSKKSKSLRSPQRVNRRDSAGSFKSVHFEDGEAMTPATVMESREKDNTDEEKGEGDHTGPGGSIDPDESDKENAEPAGDTSDTSDTSSSSTSSLSDSDYSGDEVEDETSSSGGTSSSGTSSSDEDSDSDTAPDQISSKVQNKQRQNLQSSSSSPASRSDASSDHGKQGKKATSAVGIVTPNTSFGDPSTEVKRLLAVNLPVPPGRGKQATRTRNLRRKVVAALKFHKANGALAEDATIEDLIRLKELDGSSIPPWMVTIRSNLQADICKESTELQRGPRGGESIAAQIDTKRKALLSSLALEEGVDVSIEDKHQSETPRHVPEKVDDEAFGRPTSHKWRRTENDDNWSSQNVDRGSGLNSFEVQDSFVKDSNPAPAPAEEIQPDQVLLPSSTPPDASMNPISDPSASQKRRSKLDLAGSKRLLFGSLGLKAPKTKDDEAALREKLMKEVRPLIPVKERVAEIEAADAGTLPAEKDDDSWKDKIELAAVECCHDGIVLSTPPFPFVQRWDPQQRGTFSKKKGKRNKKRKRADQNRCEDEYDRSSPIPGSPSKVARQESYDPDMAQPRFDALAFEQDQAKEVQERSHDQIIHDSAAANEQLLRETSESAAYASTGLEQAPEAEEAPDLPDLPPDLTGYQELMKQHCLAGAIIAFKKFLMSAETNWQPGISEYLMAIVDDLKQDDTLVLTLSKRDQPKSAARYHKETGERLYSKFEMPGFDDEEISDPSNRLEIPFNELIKPLLIQLMDSDRDPTKEREASIHSRPDETLVGDEAQRPTVDTQRALSFDSSLEKLPRSETDIAAPTESARQQIIEMIQDAGFRSSLDSAVGEKLDANETSVSSQYCDAHDAAAQTPQASNPKNLESSLHVNRTPSASSPLSAEFEAWTTPKTLEAEADFPKASEDQAPSSGSISRSVVQYPTLPDTNQDSGLFQDQRQHRSVSMDSDRRSAPEAFISPPPIRRGKEKKDSTPPQSSQSKESTKTVAKPVSTLDGAGDSDEFPELFSQAFEARISQEPAVKEEYSQTQDMYSLPKRRGKIGASRKNNRSNRLWNTDVLNSEDEDAGNVSSYRPSQSQVAQSSQIVDLTISSDPLESLPDESTEIGSVRSSNGWVDKPRANKDIGVEKVSNRRKTRSSSTMAYV